jgi:hypothetical protein
MIKELELSNKDDFIERFDHLYQEITGEYNFGYNKTEKINVQRHAKRTCSLFSCCSDDRDYVYSNYAGLEKAIYELLYINHIEISKKEDTNIEFITAKSHNEIIVENDFAIHKDTDSKIHNDSYTIIIYLHTNCQGGELIFYESTSSSFEKTFTVDINASLSSNTKVVIFDGEIFHRPEPFYNGQRCAIVCQVSK